MLCFTVIIIFLLKYSLCLEEELTVNVEAGKKECFFQHIKTGETVDIEYQVIDGGHGELDISFELVEPTGRILLADFKKSENVHRYKAYVEGDYKFCFDNRFSTFNPKTVFFEITVENEDNIGKNTWDTLTPEEIYEVKIQDILDYVSRIRNLLSKARQIQDMLKSQEARDRNIAEENYFKVNTWSMFQIVLMIMVGILQVFMVRSIFETDSMFSVFWKKFNF